MILPLAGPFPVDPDVIDDAMRPFLSIGKKIVITTNNIDGQIRAVLLDGAGLGPTAGYLANMLVWSVVTFAVSLRVFRWS